MRILRVPVLTPGRHWVQDVSGRWRWAEYTEADARQMVQNGNAQCRAGLSTPACWMHDQRAKPEYLSQHPAGGVEKPNPYEWMAKGWFADVSHWEFDPATREAVAFVKCVNDADADQFDRVGRVSPGIKRDYVDQRGVLWPGYTCLHIASTPKPIQLGLSPMTDVTAAFRAQYLSHPAFAGDTVWLSVPTNTQVTNMAKEEMPEGGAEDAGTLKAIVEILREGGWHIEGEPVTAADLLAHLKTAAATKKGGPLGGGDGGLPLAGLDGDGDGDGMKDKHEPAGSHPYFLSTDPRTLTLLTRELKQEWRDYEAEVKALAEAGKIDQKRKADMLADLGRVDLSVAPNQFYDPKGQFVPPPIALEIAAYQKLQPGRFAKDTVEKHNGDAVHLGHQPARPPADARPPATDEFDEMDRTIMRNRGLSEAEYRELKKKTAA